MYITSQILVVLSDVFFVFSVFSKSKLSIVFWLIICDLLFSAHFWLLGGLTGTYIFIVDIVFLITTYILKKYNKDKAIFYTGFIFGIISIATSLLTWNNYYSIFPMIGMTNYFICMSQKSILVNKISLAINNICNTIYMFLLTSYFGAGLNALLIIFSIVACIKTYKDIYKNKSSNNLSQTNPNI